MRKDADGGLRVGPTWESVTERLIREAQERGEFDDLPGHGRPIRLDDDPYAGEMALAWHVLRNAGAAPPWIEADKEVRRLREQLERRLAAAPGAPSVAHARLRRELLALTAEHDVAVARLNAEAPSATRHRRPLGPRATALIEAALAGRPVADPFGAGGFGP